MTRAELVAENERLLALSPTEHAVRLHHELDVHKEELRGQFEQLQATQKLLEVSRDDYVKLYDFAPVPYLTLNPAGLIEAVNLTACTLLQIERERLLALPLSGFVEGEDRPKFLDHMRRCRAAVHEQVTTELSLRTTTEKIMPVLLVSRRAADSFRTIVFDRTEQLRLDQAIRDANARLEDRVQERTAELKRTNERLQAEIDQRLIAEKALQESHRRKDEFLAMLAHELRNPLGPIRNAATLIELCAADRSELREASEVIERQVGHMGRIVDDLLDVSRIAQGKVRVVSEPVPFRKLLAQVLEDFRGVFTSNELSLTADLFAGELWVLGDPVRLSQILGNLLHNAIKFTDPGGTITVRLQYRRTLDEALLTVQDSGVGISAEMLARLFVPFSQADTNLSRSRGGLGLGLALVHGLVELHGGHVEAFSLGEGQGAMFTVRLPLMPTPQDALTPPMQPESHGPGLRILVIDDQRDAVLTMERLLARLGHTVFTACNGEEGLRLAREKHPQIIFSDIGLPGINGYEVAQALRSDAGVDAALLVAVTGYGQDEDVRRALAAGFDRHLVKPIALSDLVHMLNPA
ncbi:MAG TPA: ATP-binding protein [Planctomycetaceae bacterium]|nr:ATP-binding protein [Planctomycetaceae bacterium]